VTPESRQFVESIDGEKGALVEGPEGFHAFVDRMAECLKMGAITYENRSFSKDPEELLGEVLEEISDQAAWSFIAFTRVVRLLRAIEEKR